MKTINILIILLFLPIAIFSQVDKKSSGNQSFSIKKKNVTSKSSGNLQFSIKKSSNNTFNVKRKDETSPVITIISPKINRGFKIVEENKLTTITGKVEDESGIFEVMVNNIEAQVSANGLFQISIPLAYGDNKIIVKATDIKQNSGQKEFIIERKAAIITNNVVADKTTNKIIGTNYHALIIGVQDYDDAAINDLSEPIKDAQSIYDILTNVYSFEPGNVIFLKNPKKSEIIGILHKMRSTITEEDNLLIFYAGHGYWDEAMNNGYWLPSDANQDNPVNWLPNTDLTNYLSVIKSKHTLLVADACFSGGIFETRKAFNNAYAIEKLYQLPSRKAITSGTLKEVPDKSVFLRYFIKRLTENTDKYLSAGQLYSSLRIAVINNSPNIPQYGTIQNVGDEGGDFIFIKRE